MFSLNSFITLYGPVANTEVQHTANILYTLHNINLENADYIGSSNYIKITKFLDCYKLAGGTIDENRRY